MLDISGEYVIHTPVMVDIPRTGKLTALPDEVWEALERDAERCRRSVTKQIEAILLAYFGMGDVNISDLNNVRAQVAATTGTRSVQVDQNEEPAQKKPRQKPRSGGR